MIFPDGEIVMDWLRCKRGNYKVTLVNLKMEDFDLGNSIIVLRGRKV